MYALDQNKAIAINSIQSDLAVSKMWNAAFEQLHISVIEPTISSPPTGQQVVGLNVAEAKKNESC